MMGNDTERVPASVAALTQPQPEPKAGLMLTWKFTTGENYSVMVEEGGFNTSLRGDGWNMVTPDGRDVKVFSAHVMLMESRKVTIKPRKVAGDV